MQSRNYQEGSCKNEQKSCKKESKDNTLRQGKKQMGKEAHKVF